VVQRFLDAVAARGHGEEVAMNSRVAAQTTDRRGHLRRSALAMTATAILMLICAYDAVAAGGVRFIGSSHTYGTAVSSLSWSHSVGTDTNRYLLVAVVIRKTNTADAVSTITWTATGATAQSLEIVDPADSNDDVIRVEVWKLIGPSEGTNSGAGQVAVTLSNSRNVVAGAVSFANVRTTGEIRNHGCNITTSSSTAASTDSFSTDSLNGIAGFLGVTANITATSDSGQSQQWNETSDGQGSSASTSSHSRGAGAIKAGTGSTTTMSWTLGTATQWIVCHIQVKPPNYTLAVPVQAEASREGNIVRLRWRSSFTMGDLGFKIHRLDADGSVVCVTPTMMSLSALVRHQERGDGKTLELEWQDQAPLPEGGRYWLERLSSDGTTEFVGPIEVSQNTPGPEAGASPGKKVS
jgi:hypothetical protein